MAWRSFIGRVIVLAGFSIGLAGCMPPPPPPAPPPVADGSVDLMHSKVDAYNAGLTAGERLQAHRDAAALAAAKAACPTPKAGAAAPGAATPPGAAATENSKPSAATVAAPLSPVPAPNQAPLYTPGGPAIPVAPAQ